MSIPRVAIRLGLLVVGAVGVAGVALAADQPAAPMPMAVAAKVSRTEGGTRLTVDLSKAVPATATLLESPDRVVIDMPQVNFQIDPAIGRRRAEAGSLIKSFRFGTFAPGHSRLILDLSGPATVASIGTASIDGGDPARLTIDLARADRAIVRKAAETAGRTPDVPATVATGAPAATAGAARRVIVVDPGHGGVDPGASGIGGAVEKTITFDFAAMLADKLTATGRYTVVMTRKDDSFVSLGDRVKLARTADAALFVSIHADTLPVDAGVTGATVYTCSDRASDAEAARVAATENNADAAAGVEETPDAPGVNDILFDLTRRETRTYAHLFQRTLIGYWQKIARLNKNPERSAGFRVLQAPDVPSVLLELGYLSSDKDIKNLTSPVWRDQATNSIVASIDAFFAPRQAAAGEAASGSQVPTPTPSN